MNGGHRKAGGDPAQNKTPELPNYAIEGGANFPPLAYDLTNQQVQDLRTPWKKFPYATAPKLGREKRDVHRILTGSATPVRMAPYRVPQIWDDPSVLIKET